MKVTTISDADWRAIAAAAPDKPPEEWTPAETDAALEAAGVRGRLTAAVRRGKLRA